MLNPCPKCKTGLLVYDTEYPAPGCAQIKSHIIRCVNCGKIYFIKNKAFTYRKISERVNKVVYENHYQ